MKRIAFAACMTVLSFMVTAQTGKKDTALKPPPPPPPMVTVRKFTPPRIVKDTVVAEGKRVGREPKHVPPPPPPPEPVIVKDTTKQP